MSERGSGRGRRLHKKKTAQKMERHVRGIKIRTFNYCMVAVAAVLYALILFETVNISARYKELSKATEEYTLSRSDASLVREGSDYLTEQVRLFAVTADMQYARNYFKEANVTRRRDKALEEISRRHMDEEVVSSLNQAIEASNSLMEREVYSMRLVVDANGYDPAAVGAELVEVQLSPADLALTPQEKTSKARTMVFDASYKNTKDIIDGNISHFLSGVLNVLQSRQEISEDKLNRYLVIQRMLISILFIMNIIIFLAIIILVVRPLNAYMRSIKEERQFEAIGAYEFKYLALTYNDIYRLNETNSAVIREKADHDPLTGLPNRGAFNRMTAALGGGNAPMALLLADVDNFRIINNTNGHMSGDKSLQKLAGLLSQQFKITDTPARIGGDEFAVIMTEISPVHKRIIIDKIEAINRGLKDTSDGLPVMTLSIGAAFSDSGYSEELYSKADSALCYVKNHGRNGFRFYEDEIQS